MNSYIVLTFKKEFNFIIEIYKMNKNKTLLLKMFECGRLNPLIFEETTPLLTFKAYRMKNNNEALAKIMNNVKLNYNKKKTDFDRIAIIHSMNKSNARRSVCINKKRSDIIEFINNEGKPNIIYQIVFNHIAQIIPNAEIIGHLSACLKHRKGSYQKNYKSHTDSTIQDFNKALFPYKHQQWIELFRKNYGNKNYHSNKLNFFSLRESYINIQTSNMYKMYFSLNRNYLYQDMKQFNLYLQKFNFIRYFNRASSFGDFSGEKYCERLIKTINWRTNQTKQFLLLLIRALQWERFLIAVDDFVVNYEKLYSDDTYKNQS